MIKVYLKPQKPFDAAIYFDLDQFVLEFYDGQDHVSTMTANKFFEHLTKRIMVLEEKVNMLSADLPGPKLSVVTDVDCDFGKKDDV
jgi:hypothetical protein